jgi:hypothetical protein
VQLEGIEQLGQQHRVVVTQCLEHQRMLVDIEIVGGHQQFRRIRRRKQQLAAGGPVVLIIHGDVEPDVVRRTSRSL